MRFKLDKKFRKIGLKRLLLKVQRIAPLLIRIEQLSRHWFLCCQKISVKLSSLLCKFSLSTFLIHQSLYIMREFYRQMLPKDILSLA